VNETKRFECILDELHYLLIDLQMIGVKITLVGGQVISLEARALGGDGVIEVHTPTDIVIQRGYSMEPDLLFDVEEAGARSDAILDVLRQRNFKRVRTHRWRKDLPLAGEMLIDLFVPPAADEAYNPGGFTQLPAADLVLARATPLKVVIPSGEFEIHIPDPAGFLAMKLEAKISLRPNETKDSFDIYAYVAMKGVDEIRTALGIDTETRNRIIADLRYLFGDVSSPGVRDAVSYASTLNEDETALLERAAVDLFQQLW